MPAVRDLVGGGTTVASPSSLFLLVLVCVWFLPFVIKGGVIPSQATPLIGFILISVAATLLSGFIEIPPYKDNSILRNNLESYITLGVGCSFFFISMLFPRDEKMILKSIRAINWSGAVMLLWAFAQAFFWYSYQHYPEWVKIFHGVYSVGALYRQRVSGFALEPSWFAHMLNMLYLPIWLAFTVRNQTAHASKAVGISMENLLLFFGLVALGLTLSRVGFIALILMGTFLLIRGMVKSHDRLVDVLNKVDRIKPIIQNGKYSPKSIKIAITLLIIAVYAGVLSGVFYGISKADPRMSKMFQLDTNRPDAFMYYANELTFVSRIVYWQAGWNVFAEHPWFGVGLGNAGFFMPEKLSSYSWKLVEIRNLVYRSNVLLNIKSLFVRILAETGIFGFAFFICWLYLLWIFARSFEKENNKLAGTLGLFGQLVILGLLIEGFSIDSFAMPYIWFSLGFFMTGSKLISV
jgi:O-antigen ligase